MASIDEHRRRVMLVRACVGTTIEAELYLLAQARHVFKWVRARFQSADFRVGRLCVMYIYTWPTYGSRRRKRIHGSPGSGAGPWSSKLKVGEQPASRYTRRQEDWEWVVGGV